MNSKASFPEKFLSISQTTTWNWGMRPYFWEITIWANSKFWRDTGNEPSGAVGIFIYGWVLKILRSELTRICSRKGHLSSIPCKGRQLRTQSGLIADITVNFNRNFCFKKQALKLWSTLCGSWTGSLKKALVHRYPKTVEKLAFDELDPRVE